MGEVLTSGNSRVLKITREFKSASKGVDILVWAVLSTSAITYPAL